MLSGKTFLKLRAVPVTPIPEVPDALVGGRMPGPACWRDEGLRGPLLLSECGALDSAQTTAALDENTARYKMYSLKQLISKISEG